MAFQLKPKIPPSKPVRPAIDESKIVVAPSPAGKLTFAQMLANRKPITPRVIAPNDPKVDALIRQGIREAEPGAAETDRAIERIQSAPSPTITPIKQIEPTEIATLSSLIDADFPFDDSQLEAINGMAAVTCGCLTGSAGTGKTTVTKAFVQRIFDSVDFVDMQNYWRRGYDSEDDPDDTYVEAESKEIPGIAMVAYTGKASQQIKRNFPSDWHPNIMTIHRLLGYYPEWYEDFDDLKDGMPSKKVRFIPAYNRDNKLPWKIIIIDEAGMLSLDLWHTLWEACESDTRIYMIGDINQLPPTHGKSVFGFAMAKWPRWELTTIHRQEGENNSIVDNAWRVINGKEPISDNPANGDWQFVSMKIEDNPSKAARQTVKWLSTIQASGVYDPWRDVIITPINGLEGTNPGDALGQAPLNERLAMVFTGDDDRFVIDGGREQRRFAIGDRVMATKNDHEIEITNGMMGRIISIAENGTYQGNRGRFGRVADVNQFFADGGVLEEDGDFTLCAEEISNYMNDSAKDPKKKRDSNRGPASHIVTVLFGEGTPAEKEVHFGNLSEICSLQLAYAATCHKMQGGEAHLVVVVCHESHKFMLYREWLYTAITRARTKCVLLYTNAGLKAALTKQNIKGKTLKEKIDSFIKLQTPSMEGLPPAMRPKLPESKGI